jgi:Resolvase, N terminal domain
VPATPLRVATAASRSAWSPEGRRVARRWVGDPQGPAIVRIPRPPQGRAVVRIPRPPHGPPPLGPSVKNGRVTGLRLRCRTQLADGYVFSADGEEPRGLDSAWLQRREISRWADRHGWRLARVVEEPVVAGSCPRRVALREALERVESRESDGIVVARLNRVGGSLDDALDAIERIQAAGGTFVSVCDGIDLGTPAGRLILRLLLSVAAW